MVVFVCGCGCEGGGSDGGGGVAVVVTQSPIIKLEDLIQQSNIYRTVFLRLTDVVVVAVVAGFLVVVAFGFLRKEIFSSLNYTFFVSLLFFSYMR